MLTYITYDKVKEVIRLAEQARQAPEERADDPRRGGASGDDGVARPSPPPEPQPEPTWRQALPRYLEDLPQPALAELSGLYRYGRGEATTLQEAILGVLKSAPSHADHVAYLTSRADLVRCLEAALQQI